MGRFSENVRVANVLEKSLFLALATYIATSVASFCLGLALEGGLRLTGLNV